MIEGIDYNLIKIPVHAIVRNLENAENILTEFSSKVEFEVQIHVCETSTHFDEVLKKITTMAKKEDSFFILCRETHQFTLSYERYNLIDCIISAYELGCDLLLGGVANFYHTTFLTRSLVWIDCFYKADFYVIYENMYPLILSNNFNDFETFDKRISSYSGQKMLIFPFISKISKKDIELSSMSNVEAKLDLILHRTSTYRNLT